MCGSLIDLEYLSVAHQLLYWVLRVEAIATEDLNGICEQREMGRGGGEREIKKELGVYEREVHVRVPAAALLATSPAIALAMLANKVFLLPWSTYRKQIRHREGGW